jgi:hypothetical protein
MTTLTNQGFGHRLARVTTEAASPPLQLAILLPVVGWHSTRGLTGLWWGLFATVFTAAIPFAYILRGVRRGRLTDHHIGRREQRVVPLLFGLASVVCGLTPMVALRAPRELIALVVAGLVGLIVTITISHWWKMSIHMGVAAGSATILVLVFGPALFVVWPLLPLIGWSRIRLSDHTVAQVVAGAVIGGLVAGVVFFLLR